MFYRSVRLSLTGALLDQFGPEMKMLPSQDDKECRPSVSRRPLSPAPLSLPALPHAYSGRTMSKTSDSTQLTLSIQYSIYTANISPPDAANENSCWFSHSSRSPSTSQSTDCSISQSSMAEQCTPSRTYQATASLTSVGTPSRYKMRSNPRFFNPHLQMAHLRITTAISRPSP